MFTEADALRKELLDVYTLIFKDGGTKVDSLSGFPDTYSLSGAPCTTRFAQAEMQLMLERAWLDEFTSQRSCTNIKRFTVYRRQLAQRGTHTESQANPDDEAQFEGVQFSDGRVVLRWLTGKRSVAVWDCLDDMLRIHGHPEYGTDLVWHDDKHLPESWLRILKEHEEMKLREVELAEA